MQLLLAFFGLAIIASVVLSRTVGKNRNFYLKQLPSIILIVLGVSLCMASMVVNIRPDFVGIVKQNGAVENEVLNSGINFVNPLSDVVELDTRMQNDTIYRGEVYDGNDTLISNTLDGNTVKLGLTISYVVNPANAVILYKEAGTEFKDKIVQPLSHNILRRNTMTYSARDLKTSDWNDFSNRVNEEFKSEFKKHGLVIAKVSVRKLEGDGLASAPVVVEKESIKKEITSPEPVSKPVVPKAVTEPAKKVSRPIAKKHKNPGGSASPKLVTVSNTVKKKASPAVVKKSHRNTAPVDTMYHNNLNEQISGKAVNNADSANRAVAEQNITPIANDTIAQAAPPAQAPKIDMAPPAPVSFNTAPVFVAEDTKPMDSLSFSSMKDFLKMHDGDGKKLEALNGIAKINSFTSVQVLSIDNMLVSPYTKLAFAKIAYPRTVDRRNYGMVAESLNRKSRKDLDKYIVNLMARQSAGGNSNIVSAPVAPVATPSFASTTSAVSTAAMPNRNMNMSNAVSVRANIVHNDCQIIDEEQYTMLKKRIVEDKTRDANQAFIKNTVENNCFTSEQVLRIVKLLKSKKAKLDFAKMAYPRTIDRNNYNMVASTLKWKYRKALDKYIIRLMATAIAEKPATIPIANDQSENIVSASNEHKPIEEVLLASVVEFISVHTTDNARINALSKILKENYFKSAQVAELAKLFESENVKLDFAKMAYDRTVDKGTYNLVMNSLNANSQKLLEDYIVGMFASK